MPAADPTRVHHDSSSTIRLPRSSHPSGGLIASFDETEAGNRVSLWDAEAQLVVASFETASLSQATSTRRDAAS